MVNYKGDLVVAMLLAIQCYLCYFYPWFRQELWGKFRMLYDGLCCLRDRYTVKPASWDAGILCAQ
jgi:hypothetical protein